MDLKFENKQNITKLKARNERPLMYIIRNNTNI